MWHTKCVNQVSREQQRVGNWSRIPNITQNFMHKAISWRLLIHTCSVPCAATPECLWPVVTSSHLSPFNKKMCLLCTGMHRKSIEAAEQLKDDGCSSDKEDQHETSSMTTDKSDNSANNSSSQQPQQQQQQQSQLNHNAAENNKEMHQIRLQDLQHQIDHQNHQSSALQLAHTTDPEEFRNNSIACLRAKAQEHSAKILSLSADAVMLVNRTTSAVNSGTTTTAASAAVSHCDANANSLTGRQHQGDVLLTSSDTSSSMFWQQSTGQTLWNHRLSLSVYFCTSAI